MTSTPDPLTEPEATSRHFSINDGTTTQRNVPTTSSITKGESITENQHNNGEVRYI